MEALIAPQVPQVDVGPVCARPAGEAAAGAKPQSSEAAKLLARASSRAGTTRMTGPDDRPGSVLPTQGSANPALTIMAVAARAADQLAAGAHGIS